MNNLFTCRTAPGRAGAVKGWVTECLSLAEADLVSVAELACHEPGCPPIETVVTVHSSDGQRRQWHVHKPLSEVKKADVVTALLCEADN